jgi:hypothetical protein
MFDLLFVLAYLFFSLVAMLVSIAVFVAIVYGGFKLYRSKNLSTAQKVEIAALAATVLGGSSGRGGAIGAGPREEEVAHLAASEGIDLNR